MKSILLLLAGVTALAVTGCESDVPRDPKRPAISFGNDQFRDDAAERPAERATDLDKTAQ